MKRTSFVVLGWMSLALVRAALGGSGHDEHAEDSHGHRHHDEGHHEEPIEISADALERSGIEIEAAGPATLRLRVPLYGRIVPNQDRLAHVSARFEGVVTEVAKRLGDPVRRGEPLAVVESNDSLRTYPVTSPLTGTVIRKHATPGEIASPDRELFVVADLATVWLDLDVFRGDFESLEIGQPVILTEAKGVPASRGRIEYLSPFGATATQTLLARAVLENSDGRLRPGLFVAAEVIVEDVEAPVTVHRESLQTWEEKPAVFVREGDHFEARPIVLGRADEERVEVVRGLSAGEEVVTRGSFLLKAEAGKSAAGHDH